MTDQEYCRKMAELEGWFDIQETTYGRLCGRNPNDPNQDLGDIPDYRNDLNALIRIANILREKLGDEWVFHYSTPHPAGKHSWDKLHEGVFSYSKRTFDILSRADTQEVAIWIACCRAWDYLKEQDNA